MSENERIQTDRRDFLGISIKGILLTPILFLGFPFQAFANAPKEVLPTYDAAAKTLTVKITHPSSSMTFHYVENVEIKKGGKTLLSTDYKSQPDKESFSYTYPIEVAPGDVLEVKASCSIFGSRTEKLTVSK